jgi:hypothetical protein
LVLHTLSRHGWFGRVDEETATVYRTHLSRLRWRTGLFSLELKRLAGIFEGSEIGCVVLKRASLGPSVYTSTTERFFADLDVLVDLDRLASTGHVDWDALVTRARESRLGPALAYAMQVFRHLLATDCPGDVVEALVQGVLARLAVSQFAIYLKTLAGLPSERVRTRIRFRST